MSPRYLISFIAIVAWVSLPGSARCQDKGAVGASARADTAAPVQATQSDQLEGEMTGTSVTYPARRPESKTLGSGKADAEARRIENTANGLAAPGNLLGPEVEVGAGGEGATIRGGPTGSSIPELHVVQKGDTLWSLCSRYYGDPWRWPRLWAANPAITNPHWIFPGDVVRLRAATAGAPAAAPEPAAAHPTITSVNRMGVLGGNAVLLRELGFIEAKDMDQAATITGSREEKIMLSSGDQAYLSYPANVPIQAGDRYSVFTTDLDHPVVDNATGKAYGYLVKILGDIVVNQITDKDVARGTLVDTVYPIERGARVSPHVRQFKRIEPKPSKVDLNARVIATFAPNILLGPGNFVVLNCGKRDGVQVGNRAFVIRQGDGYRGTLESWEFYDPDSPKEVVGEMWVVDVRDKASVAWIVRSTKELKVGELAEMRRGH